MAEHHLTPQHFHAFGFIVSTYAKVEHGFKIIIAQILGIPVSTVMILCEPYSTNNLLNVASTVSNSFKLPSGVSDRIADLTKDFRSFTPLRNSISHDMWTVGAGAESIKPFRLDIRSGSLAIRGIEKTEREWTLPELEDEAMRLGKLYQKQKDLLTELGMPEVAKAPA